MDTITSIVEDFKDKISDNDYLLLMNELKTIYDKNLKTLKKEIIIECKIIEFHNTTVGYETETEEEGYTLKTLYTSLETNTNKRINCIEDDSNHTDMREYHNDDIITNLLDKNTICKCTIGHIIANPKKTFQHTTYHTNSVGDATGTTNKILIIKKLIINGQEMF